MLLITFGCKTRCSGEELSANQIWASCLKGMDKQDWGL